MPDFEALRTAVHQVGVEANKGIFNNLEGVLLRLVDAIETASTGRSGLIELLARVRIARDELYGPEGATDKLDEMFESFAQLEAPSTERRERDG